MPLPEESLNFPTRENGGLRVEPPPFVQYSVEALPPRRRKFQDRRWLHVSLFLLTLGTTTIVGAYHYAGFLSDFLPRPIGLTRWELLAHGLWYSLTILAILGAHELGHYFACRYYDVDASLPYFLPVPPVVLALALTGTLGAVIRIREPMRTKRVLFDIGVAGPIAGFLIAVPALLVGISFSKVVRVPPNFVGLSLGEPLLFRAASWLFWGTIPDGYSINLHPMAFAAWFGLIATMLNLLPAGQLDGGHISYAVFGRRSSMLTLTTVGLFAALTTVSPSLFMPTVFMIIMLILVGRRHPPTIDEHTPLDRQRVWIAIAALIIFVLCFTPAPIQPMDLIRR